MAVRLFGDEVVQLTAAELRHFGRQLGAGIQLMKGAVDVLAELRPMRGGGDKHGVFTLQSLGNLVSHGGMRVDEVAVLVEHFFDSCQAGCAVDGIGLEVGLELCQRFGIDGELLAFLQFVHPGGNGLCVAPRELEELALDVRGNQDVHGRGGGEHELALGDVVAAGVDEVGEHAVLVAGAEQGAQRRADLLCVPGGKDVAEVAGGNADIERLAGFELALGNELGVAGNVVHHLGKQAPPVDGVRAGKGNLAAFHDLLSESLVAEDVLRAGLAVVEVALHGPNHGVAAALGCHLLVLDVAYAAVGVHDGDLHAVLVFEALECGLAGIARGCHQDKEGVAQLALLAQLLCACAEEIGQALQRHVLEGAGGAMPQLEHMGGVVDGVDGADGLVVETVAVGCFHKLVDLAVGQVDVEGAVDVCCALGVRELRQRQDFFQAEVWKRFGDEEPAAIGKAFHNGFGEGCRLGAPSAGVNVTIGRHESIFREGLQCGTSILWS